MKEQLEFERKFKVWRNWIEEVYIYDCYIYVIYS